MDTRRAPDELRAKIEARRQRRAGDRVMIARMDRDARKIDLAAKLARWKQRPPVLPAWHRSFDGKWRHR